MRTVTFVKGLFFLHRTGSDRIVSGVVSTDEPVDTIVRASGPDGGPCDEDSLPRTGSDEPVPGVLQCWTGWKECDFDGGDDVMPRIGSDEPFPACYDAGPVGRNVTLMGVMMSLIRLRMVRTSSVDMSPRMGPTEMARTRAVIASRYGTT